MILALETVFDQCSIALLTLDGKLIAEQTQTGKREQTGQILPMIDEILTVNQVKFSELSAIAFNRGPGAFSGIRINTAVAQALAFAHDLPCLPISSLQAIAQQVWLQNKVEHCYTAIDARMNQVYFGEFALKNNIMQAIDSDSEQLLDYKATTATDLPIFGNGANLLTAQDGQIMENDVTPTASIIGQLGAYYLAQGQAVTAENALPVYLRHNAWKTLAEQGK